MEKQMNRGGQKMERYLVFIHKESKMIEDADFGWSDFRGSFDSFNDALEVAKAIRKKQHVRSHIVDTQVIGNPKEQIIRRYRIGFTTSSFGEYTV